MWGRAILSNGQEEVPGRIPYVKGAFWKSDDPDLSMHDWVWQRCRFWLTEFNKVLLVRRYIYSNLEEIIERLGLIERRCDKLLRFAPFHCVTIFGTSLASPSAALLSLTDSPLCDGDAR